jgi:hypothetical protein
MTSGETTYSKIVPFRRPQTLPLSWKHQLPGYPRLMHELARVGLPLLPTQTGQGPDGRLGH